MRLRNSDDELREPGRTGEPATPEEEDTEGHLFLPNDPSTARSLAQGRSAELEREMRERQRQKEARPNRR
ncbi:MAG TPA: hypothetical protein VMP67_10955 [Candidatus Limnocylindria bacterium]|nr:hypothetical protein [Candidatus Limnocylindria bacterium]